MIDESKLEKTVSDMIGSGRVIMAIDESPGTMDKRLKAVGAETGLENRNAWRKLILTAPDLTGVGAAIMNEETVDQNINGKPAYQVLAERNIVPGVKLDLGVKQTIGHYEEGLTIGMDPLQDKLVKYNEKARFAKWRSVFTITDNTPTYIAIKSNAYGLAVYARLCQEAGIVPIVEPEILIKGKHGIRRAYDVSQQVLSGVFEELSKIDVYLPGIILKPSMVTPGDNYAGGKARPEEVAKETIGCFIEDDLVPGNIGAIAHLSGGLTDLDAVLYLNALNIEAKRQNVSWRVTASYGRAEIGEGLKEWGGDPDKVASAQAIIGERTKYCGLASEGKLPADFKEYKLMAKR